MLKNPSHPGEILHDEVLPYHGLSPSQAAAILNVELTTWELILAGRAPIGADLADRIETAWGISAELLLNLQRQYDEANLRNQRNRRGVPGIATIIVVALLALAGIAWQAVNVWRMLT